ncbi:MAG TPA: chorismate mutase [Pseudonocardia sp.]
MIAAFRCSPVLASVLAAVGTVAACAGPPAQTGPNAPTDQLQTLVDVATARVVLSDQVSAAKFGTPSPIDDPAREHQELTEVADSAQRDGVEPVEATRFFSDQIAASKVVQRGLYQRWTAHPEQRPGAHPNLTTQVRPELDRITTQLLDQLRATIPIRHAGAGCRAALASASANAGGPLDQLHRDALSTALRSVCGSP